MNSNSPHTPYFDRITWDWLKVLGSNGVQLLFSFLSGLLLARLLNLEHYGLFNMIVSFAAVAGAVSEFGLTASASYHLPQKLKSSFKQALELGKVYFWLRVGYAALFTAIIGGFAFLLVPLYPSLEISVAIIQLAALAILANAVNDSVKTFHQVDARFDRYSYLIIAGAAVTLLFTAILAIGNWLNLTTAVFFLLIIKEMAMVLLGYYWMSSAWALAFPAWTELKKGWKTLTRSGIWIWLANIIEKLGIRLDLLVIPLWLSGWKLGVYALAFNLARRLSTVNHNLYTVVLPRTSQLETVDKRQDFIIKSLWRSCLVSLAIFAVILLADPLIPFVYGPSFDFSITIFRGLAAIVILEVFTTPFLLLFHALQRENEKTIYETIKTTTLILLILMLLPEYGLGGLVLGRFAATFLSSLYALSRTRNYW